MESFSFFIWRHRVTCLLFNIFLKMNSSTLNVSVHDWLSYNCFIYLAVGGIKYAAVLLNVKRPSCLLPPGFFVLFCFTSQPLEQEPVSLLLSAFIVSTPVMLPQFVLPGLSRLSVPRRDQRGHCSPTEAAARRRKPATLPATEQCPE